MKNLFPFFPFDCEPTVSLSGFRAANLGGFNRFLFAEEVEDKVGCYVIVSVQSYDKR